MTPVQPTDLIERERFEAWARAAVTFPSQKDPAEKWELRMGEFKYVAQSINIAWSAWQVRAAIAAHDSELKAEVARLREALQAVPRLMKSSAHDADVLERINIVAREALKGGTE